MCGLILYLIWKKLDDRIAKRCWLEIDHICCIYPEAGSLSVHSRAPLFRCSSQRKRPKPRHQCVCFLLGGMGEPREITSVFYSAAGARPLRQLPLAAPGTPFSSSARREATCCSRCYSRVEFAASRSPRGGPVELSALPSFRGVEGAACASASHGGAHRRHRWWTRSSSTCCGSGRAGSGPGGPGQQNSGCSGASGVLHRPGLVLGR